MQTLSTVAIEDSHGFVETTGDKLFSCRRVVDVNTWLRIFLHGADVVFVDRLDLVELPDVEGVGVSVLTSRCEVEGFLWVPANSGAFVHQDCFLQRCLASDVVEEHTSVHGCAGDQISLNWVESHFVDGVDTLEVKLRLPSSRSGSDLIDRQPTIGPHGHQSRRCSCQMNYRWIAELSN